MSFIKLKEYIKITGDLSKLRDPLLSVGGKYRIQFDYGGHEEFVANFRLERITPKGLYVFARPGKRKLTYMRTQIPELVGKGLIREL
jgi:hypothetical protein